MNGPWRIVALILLLTMALPCPTGADDPPDPQPSLSAALIQDGVKTVAVEAAKLILELAYPAQSVILPVFGERAVSSAQIVDVTDNFASSIVSAAEHPDAVGQVDAFCTTMALEIVTPTALKVVIGCGKIACGAVRYEIDVLDEGYRAAVAERFLTGHGSLLETYRNYLRGVTPFYQWGAAKELGLREDLGNLDEVFKTERALMTQWDRYANFVPTSVGLTGENLASTQDNLKAAGDSLRVEFGRQREQRIVLEAADYARAHKADIDRRIAENMRAFGRAAAVVLDLAAQEVTFTGYISADDDADLSGQDLYLSIFGPNLPGADAIRVQDARVSDYGDYEITVSGLRPGMTTLEFAAARLSRSRDVQIRGGVFLYRSDPMPLPGFAEVFAAFDRGAWNEVRSPGDEIDLDVVLHATGEMPRIPKGNPAEAPGIARAIAAQPTNAGNYDHRLSVFYAYFESVNEIDREAVFHDKSFAKVLKTLQDIRLEEGEAAEFRVMDHLFSQVRLLLH